MSGPDEKECISLDKAKSEMRFFGIASVILLAIIVTIPVTSIKGLALLGLAITGWQVIFQGSTVLSISLQGKQRTWFQIAISVVVPALMSLYFIRDTPKISFEGVLGYMFSVWLLIPFGIIGYASWIAADHLDKTYPFRGFLIACTVIFVMCFMHHHGVYIEYDDYTESNATYIDKEAAKQAAQTGRYFGQFLVYVVVSYAAMLAKMRKQLSKQSRGVSS